MQMDKLDWIRLNWLVFLVLQRLVDLNMYKMGKQSEDKLLIKDFWDGCFNMVSESGLFVLGLHVPGPFVFGWNIGIVYLGFGFS